MSRSQIDPPAGVPVLARGKHKNPRKGACFMELASYLAGERWSDNPRCTHPLLASLARLVNDGTTDAGRSRLAEHIPAVIGMTSDDPRVDVRIALLAAHKALPVASAERQSALAVSVLTANRVLADLDGRPVGSLSEESRRVLREVPHAAEWAHRFASDTVVPLAGYRRRAAPHAVRCAVQGIATACVPHADELLRELLVEVIDDCAALCGHAPTPTVDPRVLLGPWSRRESAARR